MVAEMARSDSFLIAFVFGLKHVGVTHFTKIYQNVRPAG